MEKIPRSHTPQQMDTSLRPARPPDSVMVVRVGPLTCGACNCRIRAVDINTSENRDVLDCPNCFVRLYEAQRS